MRSGVDGHRGDHSLNVADVRHLETEAHDDRLFVPELLVDGFLEPDIYGVKKGGLGVCKQSAKQDKRGDSQTTNQGTTFFAKRCMLWTHKTVVPQHLLDTIGPQRSYIYIS